MTDQQRQDSRAATDQELQRGARAIGARLIQVARWLFALGERLQGMNETERLGITYPPMPNKLFESRDGSLVLLPPAFTDPDREAGYPTVALKLAEYPQVVVCKLGVDDATNLGRSLTLWASAHERERALNPIGYTGKHLRAIRGGAE